jgi:hypothetical protein
MSYDQIDPVIDAWVLRHKFTLFNKYENHTESVFRAVYLSSLVGECCQIWIDQPTSGLVALHVRDIDTRQDEEIRKDWRVSISDLDAALEDAVFFIQEWFKR